MMLNNDPLNDLFAQAKANGVPMALICERAGIAPTTPSRWRKGHNRPTLAKLQEMYAALDAIVGEAAAA